MKALRPFVRFATLFFTSLASAQTITIEVDASDIARNLVRSNMTIAAEPGELDLYYCVWTPGNHTPSGPVENVIDLVVRDCKGERLEWDRDPTQIERVRVNVPAGCERVTVEMGYIASQPNVNSRSTDTYGRPTFGVLNWNTVLLYPGGKTNQEIRVKASLGVPSSWLYASPLRVAVGDPAGARFESLRSMLPNAPVTWVSFEEVPLAELIDTPLIMGRTLVTHELDTGDAGPGGQPHLIAVVAAEERHARIPEWLVKKFGEMCRQGMLLFGRDGEPSFPRERYEFLIALDETMGFGVEHATSTLIAMRPSVFLDAKTDEVRGGGASMTVIPHEYFHAWCGKLAAPEGVVSKDFHTPARTELLWVYEGLTSHYDTVLAARSGLVTLEEYRHEILSTAVSLGQRTGRHWRSVEDTARAARVLRNRGLYWYDHRRGQEYYGEGAKFWLEADAIIRETSAGARSLDDFCRAFFAVEVRPVGDQVTFTRADVVRALKAVDGSTDWDGLIRSRIEEPVESLDMSPLVERLGYRVEFADEPTAEQKKMKVFDEESADEPNLRTSLGVRVSKTAEIIDIVPDSPADRAGLAYGMKVMAVDGWVYSASRLRESVRRTKETGKVALLVSFGDRVETREVEYRGGARVPRLVRIEGTKDVLEAIARPLE